LKTKVLVWQWGRFGAGARYAYELACALSEHCGFGTLLSLAEGAELMQNPVCQQAVDLPLHTYSGTAEFLRRSLGIHAVLRPILARLEAAPPDVAIVTMMGYWDVFLVRALHRMGVPVVVVVHDAEVHPGDRFHLAVRLQRHLVRTSQGVITLSNFVAGQLKRRLSLAGKVHATIPPVVFAFADLDLPLPKLPDAPQERPLRLLMAGRLKRYKGLELLADALKQIDDAPPLNLRVVGAVQDESDVAPLAALPGVEFDLGWKSDRELIAHLDWADATILPYVEASQSGIAPISFKRGRPVIATAVGGLPEQVCHGTTGLIAEPASPPSLAAAIKRFAADRSLLRRCAENALRHAEVEISWESLAPRFAEVLETVARRSGNPEPWQGQAAEAR
jgi:glycosyltransferase involved in cell wall biosynthesis